MPQVTFTAAPYCRTADGGNMAHNAAVTSISLVPGSGRRLVNQVSERIAIGLLSQPQILLC